MGHAVLHAHDVDTLLVFYRDILGFSVSDYGLTPYPMFFFHVNGRHHSFAVIGTGQTGFHHFMVEYKTLDDVGQGYDIAQLVEDRIAYTLGRHTNDYMTSFYAERNAYASCKRWFPQPRLANGQLLDDFIGPHPVLILSLKLLTQLESSGTTIPPELKILSCHQEPAVSAVMIDLKAQAVLVRTDNYLLGSANTLDELELLINESQLLTQAHAIQ